MARLTPDTDETKRCAQCGVPMYIPRSSIDQRKKDFAYLEVPLEFERGMDYKANAHFWDGSIVTASYSHAVNSIPCNQRQTIAHAQKLGLARLAYRADWALWSSILSKLAQAMPSFKVSKCLNWEPGAAVCESVWAPQWAIDTINSSVMLRNTGNTALEVEEVTNSFIDRSSLSAEQKLELHAEMVEAILIKS